jgi:hypothetical protein
MQALGEEGVGGGGKPMHVKKQVLHGAAAASAQARAQQHMSPSLGQVRRTSSREHQHKQPHPLGDVAEWNAPSSEYITTVMLHQLSV